MGRAAALTPRPSPSAPAVDKGTGDIRFVRHMLQLKTAYPDRVHLIMGNRDCNKLRLHTELSEEGMRATAEDASFPYWVPDKDRVTPAAACKAEGGSLESRADRLRWMLKHTMGADGAFDRRRAELALLGGAGPGEITDDAVVESYLASVREGGWMLGYLESGQLAYSYGKTLFVHGAVTPDNIGWVPGAAHPSASLPLWVDELNAWAAGQVAEYRAALQRPQGAFSYTDRPGHGLMDYGVP